MQNIDIGRTAFRGFKLLGEKPWVMLIWGLVYVAAFIVVAAIAIGLMLAVGGGVLSGERDANGMPTAGGAAFFVLFPIMIVGFSAIFSVFLCGAYRWVLKPQEGGLAYLRLGGAEFRMMGLLLLSAVMWIAIYFGVALLNIVLAGITLGLGLVISLPLGAAIFAYLSVKMSLAAVINFMEGKLGIGESFTLTRNNFWNLFVVYLILFVIWLVITIVLFGLQSALQGAAGMPSVFTGMQPGPSTPDVGATALIISIIAGIVNIFISAATLLVLYAPHAEAYLQLKPRPVDQTVETFS